MVMLPTYEAWSKGEIVPPTNYRIAGTFYKEFIADLLYAKIIWFNRKAVFEQFLFN
jgi:hypothetical protein